MKAMVKHRPYEWAFPIRVFLKATLLFIIANMLFAWLNPMPTIGRLTIYNWLVEGRKRLPYGESSDAYNLSLNNLDAMFASHQVAKAKSVNEYRILVMGDSSVWGILLGNADTLTGNLNKLGLKVGDKSAVAYNLGHPIMSVTKDLLLLAYAKRYQPDMIIWLVTLESLPYDKQLDAPIVQHNADMVQSLINEYALRLDANDARFVEPNFWDQTIVGRRRELADWWRLQLFGINWGATEIDQVYNEFEPRSNDFDENTVWHDFTEATGLQQADIALDIVQAGIRLAGKTPILLVNEPIYEADGKNSDRRYNFWYPKWVYDRYRNLLAEIATAHQWQYLDLWDAIVPTDFTDSPVHLSAHGSATLARFIGEAVTGFNNP